MSEFDLISDSQHTKTTTLPVTASHFTGAASREVLQLWFGEENWDERPTISEIPGWQALEPTAGGGPLRWCDETNAICFGDEVLLAGLSLPLLKKIEIDQLPGLFHRVGEELPQANNRLLTWNCRLDERTHLFGLGQRSGPLERTGLTAVNWTTDSPVGHNRTTDPLYQAHPLLWGVTGRNWWAILLCHTGYSRFDLGQSSPGVLEISALTPSLCLQVHCADSPVELLSSLRQTLGDPSLPPLWSLGFHQSRWGYKHSDEVTKLIETFREKELPLDVVHLDIDHMDDYRSFSFSEDRFPEVEHQIESWAKHGVSVVTIVDPGLKFDYSSGYEPIRSGLEGNHFISSETGAPTVGYCWPDEALFPDFCRAATREWWAQLCDFYLSRGVSGLWIDMNEPAIFDKPFWTGNARQLPMPLNTPWGEAIKPLSHLTLRNTYGSQMAVATQKAWDERAERPWVLTRSAFSGVAPYAWSWMGDNTSWWEHLQLSLPQLSSMSLVNSAFVGVDIGGFFGHCTGDLYSAWIEASVIYPFMRAHSALGTAEQHPWSYGPEVEETARKALQLRYRLLPYIYSSFKEHCDGGLPPLRPIFFDYPEDQRFRYTEDQVMFGPNLMACPFLHRGESQRLVKLPAGEWYDFHTGQKIADTDHVVITRRAGLVPLFVKSGAVIPTLASPVAHTKQAHVVDFEAIHFPGENKRESLFYWDAGEGVRPDECVKLHFLNQDHQLTVNAKVVAEPFSGRKLTIRTATPNGIVDAASSRLSEME